MSRADQAIYEFTAKIRYSEIDHEGRLTPPALIDLFQDCSIFQSEEIGFGPSALKRVSEGWVLTHWHIVVERYPQLNEQVTIGTFANGFRKVTAQRNFYLRDSRGALIARAGSSWALIDFSTGKPTRIEPEHAAAYGVHEALPMPQEERRVRVPDMLEDGKPIVIMRDHIDTNEHVNNCQYVKMALDALPGEMEPHVLRVDFKRSAMLGDTVFPKIAVEADRTVVVLADEQDGAYGVVELC